MALEEEVHNDDLHAMVRPFKVGWTGFALCGCFCASELISSSVEGSKSRENLAGICWGESGEKLTGI